MRRHSARGFAVLLVALGLLFVQFAAAAVADRPAQSLTLLALMGALTVTTLVWLILRQRGWVRAGYIGAGAATGTLVTILLFDFVGDFAGVQRAELEGRLMILALINGAGMWLFVVALRMIFPRRRRGLAGAGVVLMAIGLFPMPLLLLQPSVASLKITDVQLQLNAAYLYWTIGAALMIAPFIALMTVPGDWFERAFAAASRRVMAVPDRAFTAAAMLVAFALAVFFAIYSFDRRPTTADEIAQLWHARMLLAGRLAMPTDPNPEFFSIDNVIDRPVWMSQFPIGGPAALAVGLLFGVPWLLNPVLTALIVWNVYRFARRAYGEPQARVAAAIVTLSPMVLMMGATHMNHTPTAWLVTFALASLPVWLMADTADGATIRRAAAAIGASIGFAATIRPLDGIVAAVVLGLVMLFAAARDRTRARSLLVGIAAGAVPIALLLLANWRTTGHPLRFGYEVLWGPNHSLGLHDDPTGNPHTAWRALLLAVKYIAQVSWISTAWAVPVVLVVGVGLMFARRPRRWDMLLLALFVAQVITYGFYWHDGQFIGPRFIFTAVPMLLILAARAPFLVTREASPFWRRAAIVLIPACVGVAWLRSMPPFGVQGFAVEFRESRSRLKIEPPQQSALRNALVFTQEGASARLLHRLWGVGVSRRDAARLLGYADSCTLLEAVLAEERAPTADSVARLRRIEARVVPFLQSPTTMQLPDRNFRISDPASATVPCLEEIAHDNRVKNTVAYGAMLTLNRFDGDSVGGDVVYVMDLRNHNEVLRRRFGNRTWYRYELSRTRSDSIPILVPYDSAR